jgi:hypothetical protein
MRGNESHSISIEDGTKETYSFEIIDDEDNYIRAGEEFHIANKTWAIESAEHSIVDGWHKVKLGVRNTWIN